MKVRTGFISNSSSSSFVVKTRPTDWDKTKKKLGMDDVFDITMLPETVEFLTECGFFPTKIENPFFLKPKDERVKDDTILGFNINCNQDFVMQLLIANDIAFKASIHYGHYLYSYDPEDGYIYVLTNFGMEYENNPKELEEILAEDNDYDRPYSKPLIRMAKENYLKYYCEETSIQLMKEG